MDNENNEENKIAAITPEEANLEVTDSIADDGAAAPFEPGLNDIKIEEEMKNAYIDYSMSVIVGRALPDARDGMKPVHRRCIYSMGETGNYHDKPHRKAARIVGDVMGKYHPHGDSAIYETIVRMAQDFSMRYMLVDGNGNFGSIDGDGAAAMRYTEVRMREYAEQMLEDIDKETVDMVPNYDETLQEPTVLPSKLPNLLLNGSMGIAVGMSTNIPTHNLSEVCDAIKLLIDHPFCTIDDLMQHVQGPDFPTYGTICGVKGIVDMYKKGRGTMHIRGNYTIEEKKKGKNPSGEKIIVIDSIPYGVNKALMVEKMGELVRDKDNKVLEGVKEIRDVSRDDIRIEIELKSDAVPEAIMNFFYSRTPLQSSFSAIMLALDHGRPKVMNLKQLLHCFVEHRKEVVTRRCKYELRKAQERAHILEGYRIAIDNMDEIVRIIRASHDDAEVRKIFFERFGLDEIQSNSILEMKLRQLTGLARERVEEEYQKVLIRIQELKDILADQQKVLDIIKNDCDEMKAKFAKASKDGDARRTKIDKNSNVGGGFVVKDYVPNIPSVISISKLGYIKRTPLADFRIQNRGGTGKTGAKLRKGSDKAPEDYILNVYNCMAHDELLFFTSHGRLFQKGAYELQESDCNTMGKPVQNFIDLRPERLEGTKDKDGKELPARPAERVLDIIAVKSFEKDEQEQLDKQYVFFATKKGVVKRTLLSEYKNVRSSGINAISIDEDDELIAVTLVEDEDKIMLISANGKCIKFAATAARKMGRTAHGVRGIRLDGVTFKDPDPDDAPAAGEEEESAVELDENGKLIVDELRTMVKVPAGSEDNLYLVTIVDNGYGKRTPVASYPTKNRGGKGVIDIKTTARNGKVVFASLVECLPEDELQQPAEGADPATAEGVESEDQSAAKGAAVLLMTRGGTSLMTYVRNISISNRNTMGVRVVRVDIDKDDAVSSGTIISAETAQEIERIRKALEEEKNGAVASEQAPIDPATAEPPAAEAPAAEPSVEA